MKKPFETEMDDTRQAVGQIVGLCTTIALHQEFGVGKTRLERIKARIDELENQNTEVIMTPDAYGRPSKDKAEAIRESWLAGYVSSDYRIPMVRLPRGRKEQQYRIAGDRAAKIAWQVYAKAVIDVLHYGPDRLERLRKESHANYEQIPAGSTCEFEVLCMDDSHEKAVLEWLNYGAMRGIGQWRNSGKGRFTYEVLD